MIGECMENVRRKKPLIHSITNYVTVHDVANAVLACGGSPVMADEPEEVAEITGISDGLCINTGTLNKMTIEAMMRAGRAAGKLGHTIVLDPVGAGASGLRTETAVTLMRELKLSAVRGNASEIRTLAEGIGKSEESGKKEESKVINVRNAETGETWKISGGGKTKGVEVSTADAVTEENLESYIAFVKRFSLENDVITIISGAIDLVSDGRSCYVIRNGRSEMSHVTGTGCQLSAVLTAFLAANPENQIEAAAAAVCTMGIAGEIAAGNMKPGDGNSTYGNRIIDAIFNMKPDDLRKEAKYEIR